MCVVCLDCISIDNLIEILTFCIQTTYFQWKYINRKKGMVLGSPLSPVIANIYIVYFEGIALRATPLKPSIWLCTWYLHMLALAGNMSKCCWTMVIRLTTIHYWEKEKHGEFAFLNVLKSCTKHRFRASVHHKLSFVAH